MENCGKYYIGLDIGTSSVGFCATDTDYNVINKNGHDLWGVVLFDEAQTAKVRRAKRCARRGVQRQKERIMLLRSLFEKEINKVDPNFFQRLKVSALWEDDKQTAGIFSRNSLFFDEDFNDKKFFKKYPTIYHLRNDCTLKPAEDIRFLYLTIHNMLKHRGNFLSESFNVQNINAEGLDVLFEKLQNAIVGDEDVSDFQFLSLSETNSLNASQKEQLKELDARLSKEHIKIGTLVDEFKNIFGCGNQNQVSLLKAISGGVVNAKSIFSSKESEIDIDFKIDGFDTQDETYEQFITDVTSVDEQAGAIIACAKQIFNRITFKKVLGENLYFCTAMKNKYELHKKQLRLLKDIVRRFYPDKYNEIFKLSDSKINNYVKYIKGSNYYSEKKEMSSKCSRQDFYKYIRNILQENNDTLENESVKSIIQDIEEDNFLPKLRTSANSVIPYQINKNELEKILENAKDKYPFLTEKDEDNLTIAEKIVSIFEFRIPYFVGPLSKKNSKNAWIVKKLDEKILPWNIKEVVDYDKCEEEFIKRMQNNCSYLSGEPVLPKCSLLYSEYMVLQELNNLQVNGQRLSKEVKGKLFDLIKEKGTIKFSEVKSFLTQNGYFPPDEKITISGLNEDKFTTNLNIYKNFNRILDGQIEKYRQQVEEIIFHATIVNDKTRLGKWLKKNYSDILNDAQIKEIKGLKLSDWGKFSKKFLDGILGVDSKTGEARTIIQILKEEPLNLMEILVKFEFDALNVKKEDKEKIYYDDIEQLYCSPAVKRGTWQSVKIIEEIQKIIGYKPEKIFVEVTREEDKNAKGKTTDSRKKSIEKCYKDIKDKIIFDADVDKLKKELSGKDSLDSKKLYLYFTQLGKCMYTGEPINLDSINGNDYDIDHIFPQSVIKDDSLDNLVLVKRSVNIDKSNNTISPSIQAKMKSYWEYLKSKKLISNEKFTRLLRTGELSEKEKKDFVARQMVITNQSAKAVLDLLKMVYGEHNVVYSKAKYVSMFRNCEFEFEKDANIEDFDFGKDLKQSLIKCRDMNDLHHAKDAYLNIFVGNVFDEKYSKRFYLKDQFKYGFNINNAFIKDVPGVLEKEKHLLVIEKTMCSNTPHIGFLAREKTGQFYKETIWGTVKHQKDYSSLEEIKTIKQNDKWDGGNISLKSLTNPLSQTEKYGHFSDGKYSYFSVIEYECKERKNIQIIAIPYLYAKDIKNQEELRSLIEKLAGVSGFNIIVNKLKVGTIMKIGSGCFTIAKNNGNTIGLHNFNQLYLSTRLNDYFKKLSKTIKIIKDKKEPVVEGETIVVAQNRFGEKSLLTKIENLKLYKELVKHLNKAIYKEVSIGKIGKKLKNTYNIFENLSIIKQVETLAGLLDIINGVNGGDLTNVGESKSSGKLSIGKKLPNTPISIINDSPTGYYKKELRLV